MFVQRGISEFVFVLTAQNSVVSTENIDYLYSDTKRFMEKTYNSSSVSSMYYLHNPVHIRISILSCPTGFEHTTSQPYRCDCSHWLQHLPGVQCNIQEQTIGRSGLVWVGLVRNNNQQNGTLATSEYCPLNYCKNNVQNIYLSKSNSQCQYNHSGTLCGGCQPGLSVALGSAQCLSCSNKFLVLLIPFALAGPVLVAFIKTLDFTISQGSLNGLIFYTNIVQANRYMYLPWKHTHPLSLFIAWLNLDLGIEICFFDGLDAYYKTWLQFVFPFYIWTIAGLIIFLAKYNYKLAKIMGNNSVPVLATLFLLSYAKLLRTIITSLSYTTLHMSHGQTRSVWSADGNIDYLGPKHAPLFTAAFVTLLLLWLPYTLLLFFGQWMHKLNCRMIERMLFKIKPFLNAHYGPLKGRHHYWFGFLHLVRTTILLVSEVVPVDHSNVVNVSILVSAILLMYIGSLVYHSTAVSMFEMAFYMNLALFVGSAFYSRFSGDIQVASYTLIGMAFLQFVGLLIFKIFQILKKSGKLRCLKESQPAEDDWELFEQAAHLRETELEGEDSDSSIALQALVMRVF